MANNNLDKNNLIYGRNPVKEALKANKVISIYMINNFSHQEILDLLAKSNAKVTYVSVKELDNMCNGVHQGVAAIIKPYQYVSVEEIINAPSKIEGKAPVILMLDGINDPHNLGAILRSADIFGVNGVIIPKHNQVMLNATVAKTSAGAINFVPVAIANNLNQTIALLKKKGYWIVSSDGSATQNYQDIVYDFPVGLVVGSEGEGISPLVLKNSDYIVKIPMYGKVNSLNASVAAGIFLSYIRK